MLSEYEFDKLMGAMDREDELLESLEEQFGCLMDDERLEGDFERCWEQLLYDHDWKYGGIGGCPTTLDTLYQRLKKLYGDQDE